MFILSIEFVEEGAHGRVVARVDIFKWSTCDNSLWKWLVTEALPVNIGEADGDVESSRYLRLSYL